VRKRCIERRRCARGLRQAGIDPEPKANTIPRFFYVLCELTQAAYPALLLECRTSRVQLTRS